MSKIIIGIHGLNNKPSQDYLERSWKKALLEGLEKNEKITQINFEFELVYWADRIYKVPRHHDGNYLYDGLYNQWPYVPLSPGEKPPNYQEGILDQLHGKASDLMGSKLDWLGERTSSRTKTVELLTNHNYKDLALYFDHTKKINNRQGRPEPVYRVLRDDLINMLVRHSHREICLIAHSMGSIIAYDALREMESSHRNVKVPHFITAGAPLGLFFVKAQSIEEFGDERPRTPNNVTQSWHNFADKEDIVAVDAHLKDDYAPNQQGIQVQDDLVFNSYRKPSENNQLGDRDHHNVYGYLRTPELSEQVRDFLSL